MRKKWTKQMLPLSVMLAIILFFGSASQALAAPPAHAEKVAVLISFKEKPGPAEQALIHNAGGKVRHNYHIIPTIAASVPQGRLESLRRNPNVACVEEDIPMQVIGEALSSEVGSINTELVHPTNKGTGVKVAILDTGIDLDHPDLAVAGNVTFVTGTTDGDDDNGHGTLVAGIVAALDNDIGVIGIAPEASLYAVKVLDYNGYTVSSSVLSGIEWAVDNNMQVMNFSFGGLLNMPLAVREALDSAYSAGIVIVAGAGNGGNAEGTGNNIWSPARYEPVIAVGATDDLDARYTASSTGYTLELMAPGVDIYSTAMGGGYGNITGTSASSPHAAGVAALLIADGLTDNEDVRQRLQDSAEDLGDPGWDTLYGQGMVNADLAINFTEPPDQSAPVTVISLNATAGDNGWYISDVEVTLNVTDSGGSGVAETMYSLDAGETWNTYTAPFTITDEGESFLVLARSWDNAGNDEGPPELEAFKIDKTPPVLTETALPAEILNIKNGAIVYVDYSGTAEDSLSGTTRLLTNTILIDEYGEYDYDFGTSISGTATVEAFCHGSNTRTYTFRLTARDFAGNEAFTDAIVTVVPD